jgi:hypothetical protein
MDNDKTFIKEHQKLAFPEFPEDDDFSEWLSDLAETDSYYVGLAVSGKTEFKRKANPLFLANLEVSLERFSSLSGGDKVIYEQCNSYLNSLKNLFESYSSEQ